MPITKQRALDYVEIEWGTYVNRFRSLPPEEQDKRVRETGYESLRDMLAHILAWWKEGMEIILAIAQERPLERKKYDLDAFNAEAVAKYKSWNEDEFMAHFEDTRQKMAVDLQSVNEVAFENRRVRNWARAIIIEHAREHLVVLNRFITLDTLQNEWATYIRDFNSLKSKEQKEFLSKQGWSSFHDLIAHVTGWWEETRHVVNGILNDPGFLRQDHDTDSFNAELAKKFSVWSDEDLFKQYEEVRLAMVGLVERLPEEAFRNKEIEDRLASDVVRHYDEHAIYA